MVKNTDKVWGEGTYNKGKYTSRINGKKTREYNIWMSMLQRCYDIKLHSQHPSYQNCKVTDEWLDFQKFAEWCNKNYIEGYQLDKDLLVKDNKIYSPKTCCFVPQEINLLILKPINPGKYPTGIQKWGNGYRVKLRINNKQKHVGCYSTIIGAISAYKAHKEWHIKNMAEKYKELIDTRAYNALINYNINFTN